MALLKEMDPYYEPEYRLLDDAVGQLYREEANLLEIVGICGILAIVLTMIGAYSMASYLTERRIKQNAVRRIMGASVVNITVNSITGIIKPVLPGILLSCPIAHIISIKWLSTFSQKVNINDLLWYRN